MRNKGYLAVYDMGSPEVGVGEVGALQVSRDTGLSPHSPCDPDSGSPKCND